MNLIISGREQRLPLADQLTPGTHVRLRGKLSRFGFEVKSYAVGEARRTADFAPVSPASEEIPTR